jgi:L,D-transpeptidase-like protein
LPKVSLRTLPMRLSSALILAMSLASIGAPSEARTASAVAANTSKAADAAFRADAWPDHVVDHIGDKVFDLALSATRCATNAGDVERPATLTVIDYSKPSTEPRLWVVDLATRTMLFEELVAHGQGSGGNVASKFSNVPDSHQSSLGLFVTEDAYVGKNGYSLRLSGLEPGINDRALERAIVIHGAPYVNGDISKSLGRLGRSHGCPAVREGVARSLIERVKGGSVVFAYYPDRDWLTTSKYLDRCAAQSHAARATTN